MTYSFYGTDNKKVWQDAWSLVCNDAIACYDATSAMTMQQKGFAVVIVSPTWAEMLRTMGVPTCFDHMSEVETKGNQIVETPQKAVETFDATWEWLVNLGMTNGKTKPDLKVFNRVMDGGAVLCGYYEDNTVFINTDSIQHTKCYLEEFAHYITGSNDNSRDFQDFAFRLANIACEMIFN